MKKNIALMAVTGILTLASCSQGPDADKTAPTVTLTADKSSVPATGGTVTLTASVNETVSQVDFYRDGVKVFTDATAPYTYADSNWPANTSTTSTVTHTYTAKASDAAKNEGTSNVVTVTQAAKDGGVVVPPAPGTFAVSITSPTSGDAGKVGTAVQVRFSANEDLKSATCFVDGTKVSEATVAGKTGYCTVTPTKAGNTVIRVDAVSSATGNPTDSDSIALVTTAAAGNVPTVTLDNSTLVGVNAFNSCTTQPGLNGWMPINNGSGSTNPSYPVNANGTQYFVKGQVRINLTNAPAGAKVEAYYKTTQPNSAVQKLNVMQDGTGYYVMFDSSYGAQAGSTDISHEGLPTTIWFRVNNTDLSNITVYPDNMAPEAINPQIDASRRINANGQIYVAGNLDIYSANKAIEDLPLGSDGKLNAGFENVCYYLVPESAGIVDYKGNNPKGLSEFTASIRKAGAAASTTPLFTSGTTQFFKQPYSSATVTQTANGYVVDTTKPSLNGRYKIYAIVKDKLGNERPSSTPFRVTFDNAAPNLAGVKVSIVDDSPLPFPALPGYVSDYAKVSVTGTLAGADGTGIGVDNRTAVCAFNGINLFETGTWTGTPWEAGSNFVPSEDGTGIFRYNRVRFDTNKWADGTYKVDCGRTVKDLLGNLNPNADVTSFSVTVDNIDPTVDVTSADMAGTMTAGRTYRPEAQVRDQISGVRESFLFYAPVTSAYFSGRTTVAPFLADPNYTGVASTNPINPGLPLVNPVEIIRAGADTSTLGGIEWKAPSYDDQVNGDQINRVGIYGMAIDRAGNATLRSKSYNYSSDRRQAFANPNNTLASGVYRATSFPLNDAQKNKVFAGKNAIYGATTTDITDRIGLLGGDVTLEVDARTVQASYGTLEVPKVYGRFNSIDWQAIRNYMVTPALDQNTMLFEGSAVRGDLRNDTLPGFYTDNLTQSNTGDPSYLANNTHRVTADQRSDWQLFLTPWMTLQGVTNTPDVDNTYNLTNSLYNDVNKFWTRGENVNTPSSRYPINCAPHPATAPFVDTYCTDFARRYDQINMIFTAGDGDFVFTGRNLR